MTPTAGVGAPQEPASGTPFPATAAEINERFVLERCNYFTDVGLWPLRMDIDPQAWLNNFLPDEKLLASYLLNSFIYLGDQVVDRLFIAAFHGLSYRETVPKDDESQGSLAWREFVESVFVTPVRGEQPHLTDSGFSFLRRSRDLLGIPEARIQANEVVLARLIRGEDFPVVFVDDFVGSGEQFVHTWHRTHAIGSDITSFEEAAQGGGTFYYCPIVATSHGLEQIMARCRGATVVPAHVLSERHNALSDESIIWPAQLTSDAHEFLRVASERAGIPDTGGGPQDWRGFRKLGLTLAFEHTIPDATLPIFWWRSETWHPLKERPG